MAWQEKQLGQLRPANTTAASLYSPASSTTGIIKSIMVANTTSSSAKFRIFVDDDGTTYDETTAVYFDIQVGKEEVFQSDTFMALNSSSGNIAVRTDTANALTFTIFGAEFS